MSLSDEIRIIRNRSLLTQVQFADKLDVSFTTVNRWEAGKARPNVTAMKKIKKFCTSQSIPYGPLENAWIDSGFSKNHDRKDWREQSSILSYWRYNKHQLRECFFLRAETGRLLMDGIGLVFSGGGGKGSYQIGVWKYLHEIGLDKEICAVSGTSVGALNAALFAGGTYEKSEKLWMNITPDKILQPKDVDQVNIKEEIVKILRGMPLAGSPLYSSILSYVGPNIINTGLFSVRTLLPSLIPQLVNNGCFSREGITDLINRGVDYDKLRRSKIPCFVTCVELVRLLEIPYRISRFTLNKHSNNDEITQILLASSAIPIIFPAEKIKGTRYVDGGTPPCGENIPIAPVYDLNIKTIIVVNLDSEKKIDKTSYPNCDIIEIKPSKNLGNFISGTLDFTRDSAASRITLGYRDAQYILKSHFIIKSLEPENASMRSSDSEKGLCASCLDAYIWDWSSVKISDSNFEKIPVHYAASCFARSSVR